MPALLTMTSSGPSWLTAVDTARSTSDARLVSACTPTPFPPAPISRRAVSSALLPSRSTAATRAPRAAIASAMPRPMPEPAPVTIATLSWRSTFPPHPALSPEGRGVFGGRLCPEAPFLDGQGVAIAAGIGAGHEGAGLRVAGDPLPAAHHPRPVVDHVDLVPAPPERSTSRLGDARLGVEQPIAVHPDPRRLDGLLQVQAELDEVEQHLRLRLEDAVRAGRADGEREGAVPEDLGRRHHGAGLAAGPEHVGRLRIPIRPLEDVVEHEPGPGHREARAEGHPERLGD